MAAYNLYYRLKRYIPRTLQLFLRRQLVLGQRRLHGRTWPIDETAGAGPASRHDWPEEKKFALVLTHDVDTAKGVENCRELMLLEMLLGFRSSFNFVPERYGVPGDLRAELTANGFEVGVHGLKHDGRLYQSREIFRDRARHINRYLHEWQAVGFRSPSMHHKLDWIHDLNIEYDASTFDTDPFEPQSDGVGTIFPFWVRNGAPGGGYVELPYTLPQDFTVFVLMGEKNIDIWRQKLDWLAANRGMVLLNVHPDYMNFSRRRNGLEEYPAGYYRQFLEYLRERYDGEYWHALPKDIAGLYRPGMADEKERPRATEVINAITCEGAHYVQEETNRPGTGTCSL
ncbi:MAG: hypothetical protein KKG47_11445 [Proteobacteria bacterium]|nr:hypothetical protein [Pseudomonadota bacterium]MBU1739429.1 hypothetical protein [Pseudomonadota bacterium]